MSGASPQATLVPGAGNRRPHRHGRPASSPTATPPLRLTVGLNHDFPTANWRSGAASRGRPSHIDSQMAV